MSRRRCDRLQPSFPCFDAVKAGESARHPIDDLIFDVHDIDQANPGGWKKGYWHFDHYYIERLCSIISDRYWRLQEKPRVTDPPCQAAPIDENLCMWSPRRRRR